MTEEDHEDMVEILLNLKGYAVLSGYNTPIYQPLENAGWIRKEYKTICNAAAKTRTSKLQGAGSALKHSPRTECLWIKPYNEKEEEIFI